MTDFKKAKLMTWAMTMTVIFCGVIAYFISDRHGYGASSEGKINILRAIVFAFSVIQFLMALAVQKTARAVSKKNNQVKPLVIQIITNAFCEIIAFFGLALVFISKSFMDYGFFGSLSLLAFIFFFPREKDWQPGTAA